MKVPERFLRLSESKEAKFLRYDSFKDFYGGWLFYCLRGKEYRMWSTPRFAEKVLRRSR